MSSSDEIAYIITPSGKRRPVRRGGLERKTLLSDPVKRDKLIRKADPGMVEVKGKKRRKKLSPKEASIRRYYARVAHVATRNNRRNGWEEIIAYEEDPWGNVDRDSGSGNSVNAQSGGRVQTNRRRY